MVKNTRWEDLYAEIGECLHSWSGVEIEVSQLFVVMHGIRWNEFGHPLRAAFEAVIALPTRLDMILATARADPVLAAVYADHFAALENKILERYKKRHEVAHFQAVARGERPFKPRIKPMFTWQDFINDTGRHELDIDHIKERTQSFMRLTTRIGRHVHHVAWLKGLPAEYYAQAGDPAPLDPDLNVPIPPPQP